MKSACIDCGRPSSGALCKGCFGKMNGKTITTAPKKPRKPKKPNDAINRLAVGVKPRTRAPGVAKPGGLAAAIGRNARGLKI